MKEIEDFQVEPEDYDTALNGFLVLWDNVLISIVLLLIGLIMRLNMHIG